ncbi:MAG: DUF4271 domain-containing protein [Tannerellaceae bacterium]|jgi:hypothetical protein|nr:DUF4271 domain-containing protein [Tannerellaceae bacterium]
MQGLEGYSGISIWKEQLISDMVVVLLLGLLIMFAIVFRSNYRLFDKMVRDVVHAKDRLSLFEEVGGNETVFRSFMIFQSLFLCSLALFLFSRNQRYIDNYSGVGANLVVIGALFALLLAYYVFKRIMYATIGSIFTRPDRYRNWRTGYTAATAMWGALLYIPVLWISFITGYEKAAVIMFVILFAAWRLLIVYKSIRIFNLKSIGILYILLYLCAQEILPLFFLYEGLKYLYNFIDELVLWY